VVHRLVRLLANVACLASRWFGPRCAIRMAMRGPCLLEVEFKVEPQRLTEFNACLAAIREWSSQSTRHDTIFEDKTDTTSLLWLSEWTTRDQLTGFVRQDGVQALLGRIAASALITECRVMPLDTASGSLRRGARGIRRVPGHVLDLPGLGGATASIEDRP
jgi:hypothetical protein